MGLVASTAVAGDHQGLGFLAAGTGRGRGTEQGNAADLRCLFVIPVHVDEAVVFHKLILFLSGKTWFDDGLWPIARLDETVGLLYLPFVDGRRSAYLRQEAFICCGRGGFGLRP